MTPDSTIPIWLRKLLIPVNILAAAMLMYFLLSSLNRVEDAYIYQGKLRAAQDSTLSAPKKSVLMKKDSLEQESASKPETKQAPGNKPAAETKSKQEEAKPESESNVKNHLSLFTKKPKPPKTTISFYDIILLMLAAGALGGVLCNLRGFFEYYRERKKFPEELVVPYYIRLFSSPLCGFFAYFLASVLVVTITVEQVAYDISFQGMISFISLAILAGFGSQEFMERIKETARAVFGQKQVEYEQQQLEEWYKLFKAEIITKEEYDKKKQSLLNTSAPETETKG